MTSSVHILDQIGEEIAPEISYHKIDFHRLKVGIWKCPNPGDKLPLLYFNGIGSNLEMGSPWCGKIAWTRDVITFDVPGCGGSQAPRFPYRPMWIARLGRKLLQRLGYTGKVDVFGISWGGMIAQQYAFQYGRHVNKLILSATAQGGMMVPGDMGALNKMTDNQRFTDPNYLMGNYEKLYGETSDEIMKKHCVRITSPTKRGYYFQLLAASGWSSLPFLPFLKVPTLILAGDRDRLVPLVNARIMAGMIPDSRLEIIKNGGHLFIITRANKVTRRVLDFLDKEAKDIRSAAALTA